MAKQDFTDQERAILALVQGDLPDSATPFADIAAQAGATEEQVLDLLHRLKADGSIRRFGATLRHQKAGYGDNVMSAWCVPDADVARVGEYMAGRPEISHCYLRTTYPDWRFNIYAMIHAKSRDEALATVKAISEATGLTDYDLLFSVKELKKTSMKYF
jgi:DNA-binding Lrp family transcriptional regulator